MAKHPGCVWYQHCCLTPDIIFVHDKLHTMALHKGKPSGINKPAITGTGVPSDFSPEKQKINNQMTRKYTKDDEGLADGIKTKHPNRNVDKRNGSNAGGYKG